MKVRDKCGTLILDWKGVGSIIGIIVLKKVKQLSDYLKLTSKSEENAGIQKRFTKEIWAMRMLMKGMSSKLINGTTKISVI